MLFQNFNLTVQQLFRITEHISTSFEKHCHSGLMYKLKRINTSEYLFNIINFFLSNRQSSVKINENFSDLQSISASVSQGSKLGLFYLTFINLIYHNLHVPILPFLQTIQLYILNTVI